MNPCNFRSYQIQQPSIASAWVNASSTRYQTSYDYLSDPVATKVVKTWQAQNTSLPQTGINPSWPTQSYNHTSNSSYWDSNQQLGTDSLDVVQKYSHPKKAFYSVVPFNTQTSSYASVMGRFDTLRLEQTNFFDLWNSQQSTSNQFEGVSLQDTISSHWRKIGTMENSVTGEALGTCTLIAHNLVLTTHHAIQGMDIQDVTVTFGYTELNGSPLSAGQTKMDRIIEIDDALDYAIVRLNKPLGESLGYIRLNGNNPVSELALLHYPLEKTLKVSVHTFVRSNYYSSRLLVYHDSDYLSSGGAYIDPLGYMTAMHLGAELQSNSMNLLRYALPLREIEQWKSDSFLAKLIAGKFKQDRSYTSTLYQTYVYPFWHNFLIDEEGRESEKILRALLKDPLKKDKTIQRNKNNTITLNTENLDYIQSTYATKYDRFIKSSLGKIGDHRLTKLFSVTGAIESDHLIPHDVWKSTTNSTMKNVVKKGGGTRKGADDMPAITISYELHRNLQTTGSSNASTIFRQSLTDLCDADKVDEALVLCLQDYQRVGVPINKTQTEELLTKHVEKNLITADKVTGIIDKIFPGTT